VPFQNFGHLVVFPQPVKPNNDLIGFIGTAEAVPFQNFGHLVVFPQPVRPNNDLIGFIGTAEAVPFQNFGHLVVFPQPVKPNIDLIGFVPGMNPRPTTRMSFPHPVKSGHFKASTHSEVR
jgi:hypothetical protein